MPTLYPIHADISMKLSVVRADELPSEENNKLNAAVIKIAKTSYQYTQAQKEALATLNFLNVGEAAGMLPF
jgi:hypothetical protein